MLLQALLTQRFLALISALMVMVNVDQSSNNQDLWVSSEYLGI
jgi:hypothetical protein